MPQNTKSATCNYCGTRAALILTGSKRHELACSSCGAPLHDLKMMPLANEVASAAHTIKPKARSRSKTRIIEVPVYVEQERRAYRDRYVCKPKKKKAYKKKRKGWAARALDEVWDVVEDIFD